MPGCHWWPRDRRGLCRSAAVKETVGAAGILVISDDLARCVDALCKRALGGRGIVEGCVSAVGAAAVQKAVGAAFVAVRPDDLAHVVDAKCLGGAGGQGVEGGVVAAA